MKIVQEAFQSTTAMATSFSTLAQIRMLEGDLEAALALYDQGLELSQEGSEFQIYLLVLKCQALLACDRRKVLASTLEVLYAKRPEMREALSIFFMAPNPNEIALDMRSLLDRLDPMHARAMLVGVNYICARLFRFPIHRENILRGALTLFLQKFGRAVIPEDLNASVPALLAALTAPGKL
jgi:hypothetical protein